VYRTGGSNCRRQPIVVFVAARTLNLVSSSERPCGSGRPVRHLVSSFRVTITVVSRPRWHCHLMLRCEVKLVGCMQLQDCGVFRAVLLLLLLLLLVWRAFCSLQRRVRCERMYKTCADCRRLRILTKKWGICFLPCLPPFKKV
jgi:hypothetical protein